MKDVGTVYINAITQIVILMIHVIIVKIIQTIKKPFFIIQDEDFLAEFPQVQKIYTTMYSVGDLEDLLINPDADTMIATIETLPDGAKESIKNIAATLIANGRVDSVKKIKALDAFYGTNFTLMSELFE